MADRRGEVRIGPQVIEDLTSVLERHRAPGRDVPPDDLRAVAEQVVFACTVSPTGLTRSWDAEAERAKLSRLRALARELAETWNGVHPLLRVDLEQKLERDNHWTGHALGDGSVSVSRLLFWTLPETAAALAKAGKGIAGERALPASARRNWQAVEIVDACRRWWPLLTGQPAPASLNDVAPFADFLREVFAVLGVKANPRAAMDASREVQSSAEK